MTELPSLELAGRRAVATAAGAGIGLVIAKLFAAAGARVAICDLDNAKLKAVTETAPSIGVSRCDLADARDVERFARDAFGRLGGVDILINNAGIEGPIESIETMKVEEWNRTLAVNLTSHFLLARTALPYIRQAGRGAIVNISSVAGLTGYPFRAPYNASKWGGYRAN
ncbi:SDR family NAD(P)-dependent oxidoreductase [Bradyrhizobium icense]|uniref:SDR family NAD(P)-dependent oxidoreductase n=1 Tax=Bradyrhizobium icense TaxID=1274631 RepID=UPI0018D4026B|nr:SDR family NAD(P)-dependent oxidoreductase [Bradyrhizobium icense]